MNKILDIQNISKAKELNHHMNPEISKRNVQSQFRLKAPILHTHLISTCAWPVSRKEIVLFFYKITFHVIALNQNHNLHLINLQKVYTICFTAAAGTILTAICLLVKAHKNAGEAYIAFLHQAEVLKFMLQEIVMETRHRGIFRVEL